MKTVLGCNITLSEKIILGDINGKMMFFTVEDGRPPAQVFLSDEDRKDLITLLQED